MIPFAFIKNKPLDTVLDSTYDYVKSSTITSHGDEKGNTIGCQIFVIKMMPNNGNLNISIVGNNNQELKVAFSFSRQAILNWIQNNGNYLTDLSVDTILAGSSSYVKTIDGTDAAQYIWFAVGESASIGLPTPSPNNTYTINYSGNFTSPESLLKSAGMPGPPAVGTYINPVIIQPNSINTYNASYGECIHGLYYFTFLATANVIRNLHLSTSDSSEFGVIISTSKNEIRDWANSGGSLALSNGDIYLSSSGVLDIAYEKTTNNTLYAAFYNPSNIGNSTCVGGQEFTIQSIQETQSGSNSGTFVNPFIISNNSPQSSETINSRNNGECSKGGFYYIINCCSGTMLSLNVDSTDMPSIGVAVSYLQNNLAEFLRTGNYGLLDAYAEGPTSINTNFYASTYAYYAVIYDPSNIGANCCLDTNTFAMWTQQLNCASGGSGRDGRYNNPYTGNTWYGVLHADGDCDVDGRIWFLASPYCGRSPLQVSLESNNGQRIGVMWSTDQNLIKSTLDSFVTTTCGNWDSTPLGSGYTDVTTSTYYTYVSIGSENYWTNLNSWNSYVLADLPPGGTWEGTEFESNYISDTNETYFFYGILNDNYWKDPNFGNMLITYYSLPNCSECGTCAGGSLSPGDSQQINSLSSISYIVTSSSAYVQFSNENADNNIYMAVFLPDEDPSTQCSNFNTFNLSINPMFTCTFFTENGGQYVGGNSDPYPLSNNQSIIDIPLSSGECGSGDFYMKSYLCANNTFDIAIVTSYNSTLAWADNLQSLIDWRNSGMSQPIQDYGALEAGFIGPDTNLNLNFTPNNNALYYFLLTSQSYTCADQTSFTIQTNQDGCNSGATQGTQLSPIALTTGNTQVVNLSDGECFGNRLFFSMELCAGNPAQITITPGNASHLQGYMYGPDKDYLAANLDTLYTQGYFYTIPNGGYQVDVYNSSPLTFNIESSDTIRTMYLLIFEHPPSNGYPAFLEPRCSSSDTVSILVDQDCPIVNVGGTAAVSGANKYNFDPFNPASTTKKSGIALLNGDPNVALSLDLLYSPLLVLDDAKSYSNVTCTGITASLYTNNLQGYTTISDTITTTHVKVVEDLETNKIYIKPYSGSEFNFTANSLYTGVIRTTFSTNVGVFVRNQIVNAGDSFSGGNSQYAYNINQVGNVITAIIPAIDAYTHTIITSGGNLSPIYTFDKYNTVNITLSSSLPTNTPLELPFKYDSSSGIITTKVLLK